jgi:hypothetical protein
MTPRCLAVVCPSGVAPASVIPERLYFRRRVQPEIPQMWTIYVGKEAVAVLGEFVREVFGPSAKALGDGISAALKQWANERTQRAQAVVVDAALMLDDAGVKPQRVPNQVLAPLLQSSSLSDESKLHARWVALLANAASPRPKSRIIPSFVDNPPATHHRSSTNARLDICDRNQASTSLAGFPHLA